MQVCLVNVLEKIRMLIFRFSSGTISLMQNSSRGREHDRMTPGQNPQQHPPFYPLMQLKKGPDDSNTYFKEKPK